MEVQKRGCCQAGETSRGWYGLGATRKGSVENGMLGSERVGNFE